MFVSFNFKPGAAYVLEYSTTLAQGDWLPLNEGIVAQDSLVENKETGLNGR